MAGHDVLAPLVDRPGHRADDRRVPTGPRADQPLVPPPQRSASVDRRRCGHPRQPGHVGQLQYLPAGQRMTRRQHEHPRLRFHLRQHDARGIHRRPDQGHVGLVIEQPRRGRGQVIRQKRKLHRGVRGRERAQQPGAHRPGGHHAGPDHQPPRDRGGRVDRRRHPALQVGQRRPGRLQERRTGRRQSHAPARAPQQNNADQIFQLPDLGRQDLLRDVDPARRRGEARLFRDRDEVPQVP